MLGELNQTVPGFVTRYGMKPPHSVILDLHARHAREDMGLTCIPKDANSLYNTAPLVWLHSEDPFRPSDILQHVRHTTPMVHTTPIAGLPELDLDNLALLNEGLGASGQVALTANDDITKLPRWLFGEVPDASGRLQTATPCAVILVESEQDSSHTDAFYF